MSANSNEVVEHPMPMSMDEVLRLPKRKALAKAASGLAESLMDMQPEMVELDGRLYPAGAEAVEVPMLKGAEPLTRTSASTTRPTSGRVKAAAHSGVTGPVRPLQSRPRADRHRATTAPVAAPTWSTW